MSSVRKLKKNSSDNSCPFSGAGLFDFHVRSTMFHSQTVDFYRKPNSSWIGGLGGREKGKLVAPKREKEKLGAPKGKREKGRASFVIQFH